MATYNFTATETTFSVTVDTIDYGTWTRVDEIDNIFSLGVQDDLIILAFKEPYKSLTINPNDTVTVDAVDKSALSMPLLFAFLKDNVFYLPAAAGSGIASIAEGDGVIIDDTDPLNPVISTEVTVYQRKTILTDAQIKALPTATVEVIPAPGVGKALVLHNAFVKIDTSGGAYTNIANAIFVVRIGSSDWWASAIHRAANILGQTGSFYSAVSAPYVFSTAEVGISGEIVSDTFDMLVLENQPFTFSEANYNGDVTTNYTGGNAANSLEVTVFYSIVDL